MEPETATESRSGEPVSRISGATPKRATAVGVLSTPAVENCQRNFGGEVSAGVAAPSASILESSGLGRFT